MIPLAVVTWVGNLNPLDGSYGWTCHLWWPPSPHNRLVKTQIDDSYTPYSYLQNGRGIQNFTIWQAHENESCLEQEEMGDSRGTQEHQRAKWRFRRSCGILLSTGHEVATAITEERGPPQTECNQADGLVMMICNQVDYLISLIILTVT
jgi:hypothetical protein